MFIEINAQLFFSITILLLFGNINASLSKLLQKDAENLIQDICDKSFDEDLSSEENQLWAKFCKKWIKPIEQQQYSDIKSEDIRDEPRMKHIEQPRKFESEPHSSSHSISSRILSSISRDGSSSIRTGSENRLPFSDTRHHSTPVTHPDGWLWSQSRKAFLPISEHYHYRSHSSSHRRTTSTNDSESYYCTLESDVSMEILCSMIHGDKQCCEDETSHGVFCCGGKIIDEIADKFK